jgi:hypothetical protein
MSVIEFRALSEAAELAGNDPAKWESAKLSLNPRSLELLL